jgi:hypothetical protein
MQKILYGNKNTTPPRTKKSNRKPTKENKEKPFFWHTEAKNKENTLQKTPQMVVYKRTYFIFLTNRIMRKTTNRGRKTPDKKTKIQTMATLIDKYGLPTERKVVSVGLFEYLQGFDLRRNIPVKIDGKNFLLYPRLGEATEQQK